MKKQLGYIMFTAGALAAVTLSPEAIGLPAYAACALCALILVVVGAKLADVYITEEDKQK